MITGSPSKPLLQIAQQIQYLRVDGRHPESRCRFIPISSLGSQANAIAIVFALLHAAGQFMRKLMCTRSFRRLDSIKADSSRVR